jgi:hypothetical protein
MSQDTPQPASNAGKADQKTSGSTLPPFTVEFAGNNGRHQFLRTLQRKFRGRWETSNVIRREISKGVIGARDTSSAIGGVPTIPGVHLTLDPLKATCTYLDPLSKDTKLVEAITAALNRDRSRGRVPIVEGSVEPLGIDKFKTLVIELAACKRAGQLVCVAGTFPSDSQIEALPGKELYDPGLQHLGFKVPKYAEDAEEYFQRAAMAGR